VAIGLLLAELITNAGKHAFPDDRPGTVRVSLERSADGFELMLEDDGIGMATGHQEAGLGTTLISRLARQAGGEVTVTSEPGHGTRAMPRLERGTPPRPDQALHRINRALGA
jgi:two-component sensor histidine kinase